MCVIESDVNHEVRTALNAIMGFAQILYSDSNTKEEIRSYARIICQQSENLLDIFNELQRTFGVSTHDGTLPGVKNRICK